MSVAVLEREVYTEAEAARILRVPPSTLHWWLEGRTYRGRDHRPVIRTGPTGRRTLTWAEFVEAGFLRAYRRDHGVSLGELRVVIDRLRDSYGTPFPLAHHRPFVGPGRRLLLELQEETRLDGDLCLVAVANGQLLLTPAAESFVRRVDWHEDVAVAWRPHDDPASPVRVRPDLRFGRPAVRGISTEVLWEQVDAGATAEEVAGSFDLALDDVRWAVGYESSSRAA